MPSKKLISVRKDMKNLMDNEGYDTIIGIDPSIVKTGYSVFKGFDLVKYGVLLRKDDIESSFIKLLEEFDAKKTVIVIEKPEFLGANGIGALTGSVVPLSYIGGYFIGVSRIMGFRVLKITPTAWKGQLPKMITTKKVNSILKLDLGWTGQDSDKADAIAIVLRCQSIF